MYSLVTLDEVDTHEFDDMGPTLRSIGYHLRPKELRPAIWEYDAGESNRYHRQGEQEELYVVLEGAFDVTIEREDDRDVVALEKHDCLVVPPESWRQLEATADGSSILVVGAPNVKDDGIHEE